MPLCCRSWTCDYCRPKRRRQLVAKARAGLPDTFITLTVHPEVGASQESRALDLVICWRYIREQAVRWDGKEHPDYGRTVVRLRNGKLPFIAVFEAQKSGEPHLHILCRSLWIDQKWLSDVMNERQAAPITHVTRVVDKHRAAEYCAKYTGKNPHKFGTNKRYWSSMDYELPRETPHDRPLPWPGTWAIDSRDILSIIMQAKYTGCYIVPDGSLLSIYYAKPQAPPRPPGA